MGRIDQKAKMQHIRDYLKYKDASDVYALQLLWRETTGTILDEDTALMLLKASHDAKQLEWEEAEMEERKRNSYYDEERGEL